MERVDVVLGIIVRGGQILICRRRSSGPFGGLWEFPGGKMEPGESRLDCLHRELREELALNVTPVEELAPISHDYPHLSVRLIPVLCVVGEQLPKPLASDELRWVWPSALRDYPFPAANSELVTRVIARLSESSPLARIGPAELR